MATVKVNGYWLPVKVGERLISELEKKGLEVKSECRDGYCGACVCQAKGTEGVKHTDDAIVTFDERTEVMPCSAVIQEDCELEIESPMGMRM